MARVSIGVATFIAFVAAGILPLAPYGMGSAGCHRLAWSSALTPVPLFAVGAARTTVTTGKWWTAGLEIVRLGIPVAGAAHGAAALAASTLT